MNGSIFGRWFLLVSPRLYETLLIAYPLSFRREYGRQMVQVFHTACRHAARQAGARRVAQLWLRTLGDLVYSAGAERIMVLRTYDDPLQRYLYLGAVLISGFTGYIHLRADADRLVILLLVAGCFVCGAARPTGAWRWALIVGLGIPLAMLIGHGVPADSLPRRDVDLPLPAPLIPALLGAYSGALVRHLAPQLKRTVGLNDRHGHL
ncbi:MAG: hypothetical protein M3Z66_19870 [Chloroflexota bacterium]|nr:hypothetical protein [Chloroflexota bacterium]